MAFLVVSVIMMTACGSTKSTEPLLSNGVDSIKVDVSTKTSSGSIILTDADKAIVRLSGKADSKLSVEKSSRLKTLADALFVKKTQSIILSEKEANGRTCHTIFTVTLYSNGQGESTRYDMGDEADGITQCTTRNIRYSDEFREFMFSVFSILN